MKNILKMYLYFTCVQSRQYYSVKHRMIHNYDQQSFLNENCYEMVKIMICGNIDNMRKTDLPFAVSGTKTVF